MRRLKVIFSLVTGLTISVASCGAALSGTAFAPRSATRGATMFTELAPAVTGIVTENRYADPKMWGERYHEFEVGAIGTGVAIGDYDGDGKPDIFVVSKTESCRLFRNLGGWKFEDVTERAGVGDKGEAALIWKQGVTFADVNNDGRLDLYVCRFGAPNLLYINQGDGTFREEAAARGLAVVDASVMGAFCDYDCDGWLDVFVQTNMYNGSDHPNGQRSYLFHNNGDGNFTNVTDRAGIRGEAQGHSATWWDFDEDGWPDLYVANDFSGADRLYRNQHDGTFADVIDRAVPHTPFSAMGSDLGDVNNDGRLDLLVGDMAATTRQKDMRSMANMRALTLDPADDSNVAPQTLRNALYLATGTSHCLEVAQLAGLAATDWTWAPRFEDLDEDGRVDLFVTTGMHREAHNTDLMNRMAIAENAAEKIRVEKSSPVFAEANLAFQNRGDLVFEKVNDAWGLNERGVSFGAAFGDLDGDGDLDLVYANYQKGVTVLRNDTTGGHHVVFALRGGLSNRSGVGATIKIETESGVQVRQLVLARGVLSSSEPIVHFGLGQAETIKQVSVQWPAGGGAFYQDVAGDQRYELIEPDSGGKNPRPQTQVGQFSDVSSQVGFSATAREVKLDETAQQPLLPLRQNRRGPALAVGDLNGDSIDDVVMGGTSQDPLRIWWGKSGGGFKSAEGPKVTKATTVNDGPIALFDADGDGTNDLLVTKGGVSQPVGSAEYQPTLWLNDGRGEMRLADEGALPTITSCVGAVAVADFNRDGRLDLFVGGRVLPGAYPQPSKSFLLTNSGGKFVDRTDVVPGLRDIGMVTSAVWSDVDGDGWLDLLLTVEWGTVKCFHNLGGERFEDVSAAWGFAQAGSGWWTAIAMADFNGDGKPDYAVGNLGLNTPYQADDTHPALLFVGDFKGDGSEQLVEGVYEGDRLYPRRARRDLGAQIPSILKRFPRNDAYARATLGELVGEEKLSQAQRFAATEFRNGVFLSQANGHYTFEPWPRLAQVAPTQGIVAGDFDGDGHADIYAVQNSYAPVPATGRFDGGLSQLLRGDGRGHFTLAALDETQLVVAGDAKALVVLDEDQDGWPDFLITRNNRPSLAFRNAGLPHRHSLRVVLKGQSGNPAGVGARVICVNAAGEQLAEVSVGGGFQSQSSGACFFGYTEQNPPSEIRIRWPTGKQTKHPVEHGKTEMVIVESER